MYCGRGQWTATCVWILDDQPYAVELAGGETTNWLPEAAVVRISPAEKERRARDMRGISHRRHTHTQRSGPRVWPTCGSHTTTGTQERRQAEECRLAEERLREAMAGADATRLREAISEAKGRADAALLQQAEAAWAQVAWASSSADDETPWLLCSSDLR